MNKSDFEKLVDEAHRIWSAEQERLQPLMPIRYMAQKLKKGHKITQAVLQELVQQGLAEPVPTGETKNRYRMLKRS